MSVHFRHEQRPEYLHVVADGAFSLSGACNALGHLFDLIQQQRARKVLIDCRRLTGKPSITDYYDFGTFVAKEIRARYVAESERPQLAYVAVAPLLDPGRLSETVATNRGATMASFERVEDAAQWLGITAALGES